MIQHRIMKEERYAYIEIRQKPLLADFIAASQFLVKDPLFRPDMNRICDVSQANLSHFKLHDLVKFVDFAQENIPMTPSARVAMVARDVDGSGILRCFAELIDRGSFRLFYSPMEARKWVMKRPGFYRQDGSFCKVLGGVA